jgi:prepilin signal peptidase PulO-like enzyme (type II secretory pathway)
MHIFVEFMPFLPYFALLLGLIAGSFLSMLISRLHTGEKGIFFGRSMCPKCKHVLSPAELIPLFSYLFLRGKCSSCKKKISLWYPATEAGTALLFLLLALSSDNLYQFLLLAPTFLVLSFTFFYDLRYKEIHDAVLLPGILWAFLAALITGTTIPAIIGALIAAGFFALQYFLSGGRWIGSGDIRIGALMGLLLGWEKTLLALFLSYLIGSIISLYLLATRKASASTQVPLGPFLVAGTVIAFCLGDKLINLYFSVAI